MERLFHYTTLNCLWLNWKNTENRQLGFTCWTMARIRGRSRDVIATSGVCWSNSETTTRSRILTSVSTWMRLFVIILIKKFFQKLLIRRWIVIFDLFNLKCAHAVGIEVGHFSGSGRWTSGIMSNEVPAYWKELQLELLKYNCLEKSIRLALFGLLWSTTHSAIFQIKNDGAYEY